MDPRSTVPKAESRRQPGSGITASAISVPYPVRYPGSQPQATTSGGFTADQFATLLFEELRGDPATTQAAIRILARLKEIEANARRVCPACNQPLPGVKSNKI